MCIYIHIKIYLLTAKAAKDKSIIAKSRILFGLFFLFSCSEKSSPTCFFLGNRLVRTSVQEDLASPNRTNWLDSIIARERNEEVMAVKGKNFRDDAMSIAGANRLHRLQSTVVFHQLQSPFHTPKVVGTIPSPLEVCNWCHKKQLALYRVDVFPRGHRVFFFTRLLSKASGNLT